MSEVIDSQLSLFETPAQCFSCGRVTDEEDLKLLDPENQDSRYGCTDCRQGFVGAFFRQLEADFLYRNC